MPIESTPPLSPADLAGALPADVADVVAGGSVEVRRVAQVVVVTLNRPRLRNAVSYAMWRAMPAICAALEHDAAVRAVVLTGAGGHFSAGADIGEFATARADAERSAAYEAAVDACCDAISALAKPTIAVVDGFCLGGGAYLACSCDFRFAAANAVFGIPAARLSIVYGVKATTKLLALVGLAEAKKILYGAQRFGASQALRIGLVDHVAQTAPDAAGAAADPMADALAYAELLARNAPLSIAGAKAILTGVALSTAGIDEARVAALIRAASTSRDHHEGRAAFAAKREPRFEGH
jgi:enoyl-CoA hydratase/carnithine racemase